MSSDNRQTAWRLVISDMDGTLLDSHSHISPENKRAIDKLAQNNIGFTIATGRMDRMVRAYVRELRIAIPIIACNGAVIRDCATDEILWRRNLPVSQTMDMINWLQTNNYDYLCYTPDLVYYPAHSRRVSLFYRYNQIAGDRTADHVTLCPLEGREEMAVNDGLIKLLAVPDGPRSMAALRGKILDLPGLGGVASMADAFDIMAGDVSKGNALKHLAGLLGLRPGEIAAIGDNDNDADMLSSAGLGIAMANATPQALAAASLVTSADHDHSGLAEAIENMIIRSGKQ